MSEQDAEGADDSTSVDQVPEETAAERESESVEADDPSGRSADEADSTDPGAEGGETGDAADADYAGSVDESLVERVRESDPESVARELASLRTRVDGLEGELEAKASEVDDLTAKLKRKQADFQNYKKRMEKRREDEKRRAAEDLVTRLLDVRDNLARALDQDEDADIRGGVESTLRQFDDVLEAENVEVVEPDPGEEVDPHRHEVLVRVASDQPEGTVAEVHRPGYLMADAVLREAQVTVSEGPEE